MQIFLAVMSLVWGIERVFHYYRRWTLYRRLQRFQKLAPALVAAVLTLWLWRRSKK